MEHQPSQDNAKDEVMKGKGGSAKKASPKKKAKAEPVMVAVKGATSEANGQMVEVQETVYDTAFERKGYKKKERVFYIPVLGEAQMTVVRNAEFVAQGREFHILCVPEGGGSDEDGDEENPKAPTPVDKKSNKKGKKAHSGSRTGTGGRSSGEGGAVGLGGGDLLVNFGFLEGNARRMSQLDSWKRFGSIDALMDRIGACLSVTNIRTGKKSQVATAPVHGGMQMDNSAGNSNNSAAQPVSEKLKRLVQSLLSGESSTSEKRALVEEAALELDFSEGEVMALLDRAIIAAEEEVRR